MKGLYLRMINIRKDLIEKELERDINVGYKFTYKTLSNKFLDWLFNNYYCHEFTEHFYDSEPDVDDYISDLAYMYDYSTEDDINNVNGNRYYTKQYILEKYGKEYSEEEARKASIENKKIYNEYMKSPRRIEFNNWIDVIGSGIWGMSQHSVDKIARDTLLDVKKLEVKKKGRLFISTNKDDIRIYFYGRDLWKVDYWFIFTKKDKKK